MRETSLLSADLREPARALLASGRLCSERDPELYRQAVRGRAELTAFFRGELGWHLDITEAGEMVRLHKRRSDVPTDRGPRLRRDGRDGPLAGKQVLVLVALVCEQLWLRPRMTLNDLLQAIAQVSAADSERGQLPPFRIVATDGTSKKEAHANRQALVDALRLLESDGTLTVDADLDRAVNDEDSDLVVTSSRDRLAVKFSSLSPALLRLSDLAADRHLDALSSDTVSDGMVSTSRLFADEPGDSDARGGSVTGEAADVRDDRVEDLSADAPDETDPTRRDLPLTVEQRRLQAMRRLVDDPGCDPNDALVTSSYLQTPAGRERALNVLASLGLAATVRRDWWQVADPAGDATALDFPAGRRTERQAALALLAELSAEREPHTQLTVASIVAVLSRIQNELPRWAAAYHSRPNVLARAAAHELVAAGLLAPTDDRDVWQITPAVHLWRVRVKHSPALTNPPSHDSADTDGSTDRSTDRAASADGSHT